MTICLAREQPSGLDWLAIPRAHQADVALGKDEGRGDLDAEQVSVDAVLAGRQDVDLWALLAARAQERLTVLVGVMACHLAREDATGIQRRAVDRFENAHLIILDEDHVAFGHLKQEWRQEVKARCQHSRLDTHFATHRDDAALRQRPADEAAFHDTDLLAPDVDEHIARDDEDGEQHEHDADEDEKRNENHLLLRLLLRTLSAPSRVGTRGNILWAPPSDRYSSLRLLLMLNHTEIF